jgi:hypothetical protein
MTADDVLRLFVLVIFNAPIIVCMFCLPAMKQLSAVLKEKSASNDAAGVPSYSRITGLFGAVMITSLFWAVGNLVIYKALGHAADIKPITDGVAPVFMVGSALFLPYAFNQVRAAFSPLPPGPVGATDRPLAPGVVPPGQTKS